MPSLEGAFLFALMAGILVARVLASASHAQFNALQCAVSCLRQIICRTFRRKEEEPGLQFRFKNPRTRTNTVGARRLGEVRVDTSSRSPVEDVASEDNEGRVRCPVKRGAVIKRTSSSEKVLHGGCLCDSDS